MKVKCDNCGIKFKIKKPNIEKIKAGIKEVYFECPECNTKFHSYYVNKKVEKIMEESTKLYNKIKISDDLEKINKLRKRIQINRGKIVEEQKLIKDMLG